MTKKEVFVELQKKVSEQFPKAINYDELSAYILTMLQYGIQLIFERENRIVGVGPKGVIYRLGNMLYQYTDYPEQINTENGAIQAVIDGVRYSLFAKNTKVRRPAKKGCSFGTAMQSISDADTGERHVDSDIEFD